MEKDLFENVIRNKGFSKRQVAFLCGIDYSVFCSRVRNETEFTLEEINSIIDCLELSSDEIMLIFFGK